MNEYIATLRVNRSVIGFRETQEFPLSALRTDATCLREEVKEETVFTYRVKSESFSSDNYHDLESIFFDVLSIVDLRSEMLNTFSLFTYFVAGALGKVSEVVENSGAGLPIIYDDAFFLFTLQQSADTSLEKVKVGNFVFVPKVMSEIVNEYVIGCSEQGRTFQAGLLVKGDTAKTTRHTIAIDVRCGLNEVSLDINEHVDLLVSIAKAEKLSCNRLGQVIDELSFAKQLNSAIKQFLVSRPEIPDYYKQELIIVVVDEKGDRYAVYPDGTRKKIVKTESAGGDESALWG